jgi:hypothetical protein
MINQTFGGENMSSIRVFEWHARFRGRPKEARQVKSNVKSMIIILFYTKKIIYEEFILASQRVNSTYYYNLLRRLRENVRRIRPELWQ